MWNTVSEIIGIPLGADFESVAKHWQEIENFECIYS
jgi:hypothetical protein